MFGVSKEIWKGYSFKEKLYVVCKKMGILKFAQFINRKVLGNTPEKRIEAERERRFHQEFEVFLDEIKHLSLPDIRRNILFSGYLSSYRKGGNGFFEKVLEELPGVDFVAMSQSGKELTRRERNQIAYDTLLNVPRVPFFGGYDINLNIHLSDEMKAVISERTYIQEAIENIKSYHDDMGEGYAEALVYYTHLYTKTYIESCHPMCVIVHNKLYPMHDVIIKTCEEQGVKALYFEFGALPGTFALEDKGQMGASHVSTDYEEFKKLPVSDEELKKAKSVCDFLKTSGLNRNQQVVHDNTEFWNRLKKDRPIILYAGQNDYDSGICPYTEYSRKYHSPIFENSDQAAVFLADLAKKYDWNLIYKPHPLPVKHGRCLGDNLPSNVIWISDIDINEIIDKADVVVTILSQVGDVALIRDKAVVMLGYTQLRGKGCAYEAYNQDEIEKVLVEAVEKGYTDEQKAAFVRHVAQVNKYYLYDDLNPRDVRFGRSVSECADYIKKSTESSKDNCKASNDMLFYCKNVKETILSIQIIEQNNLEGNKVLLLDESQASFCNLEKVKKYFNDIQYLEEKSDLYADYLFVSCLENADVLYAGLKEKNPKLEIYLFDGLDVEKYCTDYKKSSSEALQDVRAKFTWKKSLEIWKSKNFKYIQMKTFDLNGLAEEICNNNMDIQQKYIYVESKEFAQKVVTNEMDILEQFAKIVGKENILVKLYSEESAVRFKIRGYNIGFQNEQEWKLFQVSKCLENKVIVGIYPNDFISLKICDDDLKCNEIYLYPLLVGNVKYVKSNTFIRFIARYKEALSRNKTGVYSIENFEKLGNVINYIGE